MFSMKSVTSPPHLNTLNIFYSSKQKQQRFLVTFIYKLNIYIYKYISHLCDFSKGSKLGYILNIMKIHCEDCNANV